MEVGMEIRARNAALSIAVAFILWYLTFIIRPFNFWLMMTFNTVLLSALAFRFGGLTLRTRELTVRNALIGLAAGLVLYGVFWLGHHGLILIHAVTGLLPERAENLGAIYANRGNVPPALVAVLLFFPIGFGEEVYWRGFVQNYFTSRWNNPLMAFAITVILYTGVHVPTGNPVLILASFVCGIYWSGLYAVTGSLVPVIISHMVWDPLIFVFFPIR
jgi:uncharacterized protein